MDVEFVNVQSQGRSAILEYQWISSERIDAPLIVFLHEGLGCLATWGNFPQSLCNVGGFRGLVFSRYGYGHSTPRQRREKLPTNYLHQEACDGLPAFLSSVAVNVEKPWLLGCSDGASIALIYAASFPDSLSGVIALAPHIFLEDVTIHGVVQTKVAYEMDNLRQSLARHHAKPDSVFWGWNDVWLDPTFRHWSIKSSLHAIRCPLLAVQGCNDEYGTMKQIDEIKRQVPHADLLKLRSCRHLPHRDQPQALTHAVVDFVCRAERNRTASIS